MGYLIHGKVMPYVNKATTNNMAENQNCPTIFHESLPYQI
jgi:hypothetical protein